MATEAYVDDVLTLVQLLTQNDAINLLIERAPDVEAPSEFDVRVYVEGNQFRQAIAVQQLVQLGLDAAAITVESFSRDEPSVSREYVEEVLRDQIIEVTIFDLATGSFLGRIKINPKTATGRRRILALASVTALAFSFAFPPAGIALGIVGGLQGLNELLTPDAAPRNPIELKTVDTSDATPTDVRIDISVAGHQNERGGARVYLATADLDGPPDANQAFLDRVHNLESVEKQSRFISGASGGHQRVRIWSSEALDSDILHRFADEVGTSIVNISFEDYER